MIKSRFSCLILTTLLLVSCKGPKGDAGPVGPAGSLDLTSSQNTFALKFLGTDGYVAIPFSPVLKPQSITIELWVYVDSLTSQFTPLIAATNINEWNMADGYSIKFESGYYYFRLAKSATLADGWTVLYTPPLRQWIHLAATYDKKEAILYINGQQVAQYPDTSSIYYGSQGLTFGTGYHSNFGGYSYLHGMMDEIRIWNYALSVSQIQQTMNAKLTGNENDLVGYWNFDNNELNPLALDATQNHNNGLIWGDAYYISTTPFK